MKVKFSRRDFLKIGALALGSLAFRLYFRPGEQPQPYLWGRVTIFASNPNPLRNTWALCWAAAAPGGYSLPGVPWTCFFVPETGVAFHGAYWHNNFGAQMSRGCVNMRPSEVKWLFRWYTPIWEVPVKDRSTWDRRGYGSKVRGF